MPNKFPKTYLKVLLKEFPEKIDILKQKFLMKFPKICRWHFQNIFQMYFEIDYQCNFQWNYQSCSQSYQQISFQTHCQKNIQSNGRKILNSCLREYRMNCWWTLYRLFELNKKQSGESLEPENFRWIFQSNSQKIHEFVSIAIPNDIVKSVNDRQKFHSNCLKHSQKC